MAVMHLSKDELLNEIGSLSDRVSAVERRNGCPSTPSTVVSVADHRIDCHPSEIFCNDRFLVSMYVKALAKGFRATKFTRCPDDYYSWTLEKRRAFLRAPSTEQLCKSIVMCNARSTVQDSTDVLDAKYYCVIVQYHTKFKAEDLMRILRRLNAERGKILGSRHFNFRLAEDCEEVTGYVPNAVTPLGLKTPMPIVLDKSIIRLQPPEMWMGGGEVSLKWNVRVAEFVRAFEPIVGDVSPEL